MLAFIEHKRTEILEWFTRRKDTYTNSTKRSMKLLEEDETRRSIIFKTVIKIKMRFAIFRDDRRHEKEMGWMRLQLEILKRALNQALEINDQEIMRFAIKIINVFRDMIQKNLDLEEERKSVLGLYS